MEEALSFFENHRRYDEWNRSGREGSGPFDDYENEDIRYVKSTGLLQDDDVSINRGICAYGGCIGVATPDFITDGYTTMFHRKRDPISKENLEDGHTITFLQEGDDEEDGGVYYSEYYPESERESVNVLDGEEIVLELSKIVLHYRYPMLDEVTFSVKTKNVRGFTRDALLKECFRYYRLLHQVHKHYDMNLEEMRLNEGRDCFQPVEPFEENGIAEVIYNKTQDVWVVEMMEYV